MLPPIWYIFLGHNEPQTNWRELHNQLLCTKDRRESVLIMLMDESIQVHITKTGHLLQYHELCALKILHQLNVAAVEACCRNHKYFESFGESDVAHSKRLLSMKQVEPIKSSNSSNKLPLDRKTALNSYIGFKISISSHIFHGGLEPLVLYGPLYI